MDQTPNIFISLESHGQGEYDGDDGEDGRGDSEEKRPRTGLFGIVLLISYYSMSFPSFLSISSVPEASYDIFCIYIGLIAGSKAALCPFL